MKSDPNTLQEALEDGGYECRSYSGRGMMGKECLGVDIGLGQNLAIDTHADLIRKAKSDSMGLGVIFYWPEIPYTESDNGDKTPAKNNDKFVNDMIAAFPGLMFDNEVNGADLVEWISRRLRERWQMAVRDINHEAYKAGRKDARKGKQ